MGMRLSRSKLYEKAVELVDWNVMRRTTATMLILCLLGTQMPVSIAAGSGSSETGGSGFQTESNAAPSARGTSTRDSSDDVDDEGDDDLIYGMIRIMDDGKQGQSGFDDLAEYLELYVNGELATGSNLVKLDKDGSIIASASDAIMLEDDVTIRDSVDLDDDSESNDAQDGFLRWYWYVKELPVSGDGENVYSIRDKRATPGNADPIDGYALFYTDEGGYVVDTDGSWRPEARNLVYAQKGTIKGSFENEDGAIQFTTDRVKLDPAPYAADDDVYTGDADGWIETGAGSWCIVDALMFNPETGEEIIWRGQVEGDALNGQLIRYDNTGEYAAYEDSANYIYKGGTIVNCSTTCQVTGTILWSDDIDVYGKRPAADAFVLRVTDASGAEVSGVDIKIEEGDTPGTWNYTISGLPVNDTYKVKATAPTGYVCATDEIEFTARAGTTLQEITMQVSTPGSVTIEADVIGLKASEQVTLTYILSANDEVYTGRYSYTLYLTDGTTQEVTGTGSEITIEAGQRAVVTLIDTVEANEVAVTRQMPDDSGVLYMGVSFDAAANSYVFQYSALKSVEACIVWNDNNNQYGVRPYSDREEYLNDNKIHLYFRLGEDDDTEYELTASDLASSSDALKRLGLDDTWAGFSETGTGTAEWYYTAGGLPTYALLADGTVVEVFYEIRVDDVDNYITTNKGWSQAPDDARLDSWKFIYTSKTEFKIEVLWLDDNTWNETRPDANDWKATVSLYQVSTNPGTDSAERTKEINLTQDSISFVVDDIGDSWKVTISDLPEYDENGYPYIYYLEQGEVTPKGEDIILNDTLDGISYVSENNNTGNYNSKTDGCYQSGVIKNTLTGELNYSATKIWIDGREGATGVRPEVTLTLWRYIKGNSTEDDHSYAAAAEVSFDMEGKEVEVTLEHNTVTGYYDVVVSGNLALFDNDGHEYIYFVRESLSGTNASQYICEIDNSAATAFEAQQGYDGSVLFPGGKITNRLTGKVTVNATKTWIAKALQGMKEATITVALERKLVSEDEDRWEAVLDKAGNPVTKVVDGFKAETMTKSFSMGAWDKYDDAANEYEYRVVEIGATLNLGDGEAVATDFDYDDTGVTSYKIEAGGETYIFSCTTTIDIDGKTIIENKLADETYIEIHKYWEKTSYEKDGVDTLYFHVIQNGTDICELLGGSSASGHKGCLAMDVSNPDENVPVSNWYHWYMFSESLPKYDEYGAEYVYSIKESEYTGRVEMWYDTSDYKPDDGEHYGVNVYNGGSGDYIPVVKNWLDDGDVLHREPVTVALYKKTDPDNPIGETKELKKSNVWSEFFPIEVGTTVEEYIVKEVQIGTHGPIKNSFRSEPAYSHLFDDDKEYIKTDEHIYQVTGGWDGDDRERKWVINNLRIGTIDIHLEKKWIAGADVLKNPNEYSAEFSLLQNSSPYPDPEGTLTLTYDSSTQTWEGDFLKLPKYDEKGVLYNWSIEEKSYKVPDSDSTYSRSKRLEDDKTIYGAYHTGDFYSYVATNTRKENGVIVFHKIWKDNNGKDGVSRPDIYLKLYRAVDTDEDGVLDDTERDAADPWLTTYIPIRAFDTDYHWTYTYNSLPMYNEKGFPYIYFAVEGMPASKSGGWKTVYWDSLNAAGLTEYVREISSVGGGKDYMPKDGIVVNYREGSTYVSGNKIWSNMGNILSVSDYPYELFTLSLYSAILDKNGNSLSENPVSDEHGVRITTIEYNDKVGNFTYNFGELPKYDSETGSRIYYYVKEAMAAGDLGGFKWDTVGQNFTLTNNYDGGKKMSLKVVKEWDFGDAKDEDGNPLNDYPTVTFTLYRKLQMPDGNGGYDDLYSSRRDKVDSKDLIVADGSVVFPDLPYYGQNGYPYRYYIEENSISGYKIMITVDGKEEYSPTTTAVNVGILEDDENEIIITNKFQEELVTIKGTKTWANDSGWGIRPNIVHGITLTLWRTLTTPGSDEEEVDATLVWRESTTNTNQWIYEFEAKDQPFYRYTTKGEEYTYYVKETAVPGYNNPANRYTGSKTTDKDGLIVYTINMTNTLATTSLTVEKLWNDNSDKYGTRPASITVKLQRKIADADDSTFADVLYPAAQEAPYTKSIGSSNNWTATFAGLPIYAGPYVGIGNGRLEKYTYRAVEIDLDKGYASASNATSGKTTITNTLIDCNLWVKKVWNDNDDQDGIRPEDVVVYLYKTTAPENPESGELVYEYGNEKFKLNEGNKWIYEWDRLPKYSPEGKEYYYYVVEDGTNLASYSVTYSSTTPVKPDSENETWLNITNAYTPKEMSVTVEKAWVGSDRTTKLENEAILPDTITWQLQRRFKGNETWIDVEDDGRQEVGPGADNNYIASWNNLPIKGREDVSNTSKVIEYQVVEITVPGYETSYSNGASVIIGDIKETDEENQKSITVTNRLKATTQVKVTKKWNDDLPDYNRSDEIDTITFKLQSRLADNGDDFADVIDEHGSDVIRSISVINGINTVWARFKKLPRYNNEGWEYEYRAVEASFTLKPEYGGNIVYPSTQDDMNGTIGGYTFDTVYSKAPDETITDTATGSNVTITNTLSRRSVTVEKVWDDADNQDGVRPTEVVVELRYDDKSYVPAKKATLSNATKWKYTWEGLPEKHANGKPFEYSVVETAMEGLDEVQWGQNNGYKTAYSGVSTLQSQHLTVTNTRTPKTTEYTVYKFWDDSNEYDWSAERPDSIQVQLYRQVNGGDINKEGEAVTLYAVDTADNKAWTYTWSGLPKYGRVGGMETNDGTSYVIQYSVKEVEPGNGSGYNTAINGNEITNTLRTTQLTVTKEWEDQNNYYGMRPQTITIQLQRSIDGKTWTDVAGVSQELDIQDSSQTYTFIGLPIRNKENKAWQYRAVETSMDGVKVVGNAALGYKVEYDHQPNKETVPGNTVITNTLETVDLSGKKVWEDQSNHYGARPENVELTLKSNPENALDKGLLEALVPDWSKAGNTWTYTYTGLPKYTANGKTPIVYSVEETVDAVYAVSYDAAHKNLTNTMKTGFLAVTKIQEDGYLRDFTFRVKLNINGVETLYTGAYTVLESGAAWNQPGEVRQTDESGAIVILRNQQFVITGLPASAAYVVTEDPVSRYTLISTENSTGVIPYQDAATASFTNKYTYTGGGDTGGGGTGGGGPTDSGYIDTSGWPPGIYSLYVLNEQGVPQGQMLTTIEGNETPLADLAKTGDASLPAALLILTMLGAIGGITALVVKRRKEEE